MKTNKTKKNIYKLNYMRISPYMFIIFISIYLGGLLPDVLRWITQTPMAYINEVVVQDVDMGFINFARGITTANGQIVSTIIFIVLLIVFYKKIRPRLPKIKKGKKDEERNFTYSDEGTYGTSGWMSEEETKKVLEVKPIEKTKGNILGYLADENDDTRIVSMPTEKEFNEKVKQLSQRERNEIGLNGHIAVLGASGTMKSRGISRNLIIQAVVRGESCIVTDPSGELYSSTSEYARGYGYDVKMLNLVDQRNSDSWNGLQSIVDSEDPEVTAKIFAEAIMNNAPGAKADYWGDNALNLLKALCLYVAQTPNLSPTMPQVYDILSTSSPETLDTYFSGVKNDCAAKRAYNIFKVCKSDVKGQIANGLGILLDAFQSNSTRNITSHNEIEIDKPGREKCIYYIVTSDQHKAFDYIAVLFYTMLFIRLAELAQKQSNGKLKVPVNLILDEFANIGSIPDFTRKISTVRKYNIRVIPMFQNIPQLMNRYPYGQWQEILGNCDTILFLGCTDIDTAKWVTERTGIASIKVSTDNTTTNEEYIFLQKEPEERTSEGTGKRNVLNPDEVMRYRNSMLIAMIRGQKPLQLYKCDYTEHPESKKFKSVNISDYIPQWRKELMEKESKDRIFEEEIVCPDDGKTKTTITKDENYFVKVTDESIFLE